MPSLLDKHNRTFAVQHQQAESAYMPLDSSVNLDHVFTIRQYRQLGHGNTLSYNGKIYTFAKPCDFCLEARRSRIIEFAKV